jgi:hypothetical protein
MRVSGSGCVFIIGTAGIAGTAGIVAPSVYLGWSVTAVIILVEEIAYSGCSTAIGALIILAEAWVSILVIIESVLEVMRESDST